MKRHSRDLPILQCDLKGSVELFRRLYETTPAMLHSIDSQGRLLGVSDIWLAKMGYRREEVIGRPSVSFLTPASRERAVTQVLPLFFKQGRCDDVEYQMVTRSGQVIDVLMSAILERDASGQPLCSTAVIQDVTQRHRAERALLEERQRLAYIIEGTHAGTWEWNIQTGETRFNEQWAQIIGHTLAELEPVTMQVWYERAHPQDLVRSEEVLARHYAGEIPTYECQVRLRHRLGHWTWVLSRGRVKTWTVRGEPEWMYGVDIPITELKQQEEALRKSQSLLSRMGEVAGVGGWEFDLVSGQLTWSDETCRLHGVEPGYQPTFQEAIHFYPPESRPSMQAAFELGVSQGKGWDLELPLIRASGETVWVHAVGAVEFENGVAVRVVGALQDVTDARCLRAELSEQHELLRVTLQSIADAVITTDAQGRVVWLNPVAERMTGWSTDQARGHLLSAVFHIVNEVNREPAADPLSVRHEKGKVAQPADHRILISRSGAEFGIEDTASPIRNGREEVLGFVLVFHDVTEQRRLSGEMSYRATHDALTGLVNRSEFETRLRHLLQQARDEDITHALMYIDLDQFKLINDSCGHSAGDRMLQQAARLFGESIRGRDTLARLGGDEFAIILEHCSIEHAQRVAQQICDSLHQFRFVHDGRSFRMGASIGLVPIDGRSTSAAAVMQAGDTTCFAAKEAGRNRVHVWRDTDTGIRKRHGEMQWAMRIEHALDENRFVLHAQRIERLADSPSPLRAEVLLRMVDEDSALVLPGAFLPAAERFHLASRIDRWVLQAALSWLRAVPDPASMHLLCVNLSGQSIGDRAFHRYAIDLLSSSKSSIRERICLEITETAAVMNMADAALFVQHVRALGVQVALDDFGAGASSFGYLKSLTVDYLKIDGQFIRHLLDDALDQAAVRCFVEVARVMGLRTVAEFVDQPRILAKVREMGIDYAQGFLVHRPVPIDELLPETATEAV
jgi:diguanylate cyclase (GGDEF)-like protein/PAS domain S-box-containing protein